MRWRDRSPQSPPFLMKSILIPASNNGMTFVKVGNSWVHPTIDDMEKVRDWVMTHKNVWAERKKLKDILGLDIKIKIFPQIKSNNQYVWLIANAQNEDYFYAKEDTKIWLDVFGEESNDPDFVVFIWGGLIIKRLNKVLVPFL